VRIRVLVGTALLISLAAVAQAQFSAGVALVAMDVCATDRAGQPAPIGPDDLAVFDDGVRQQIALFSPGIACRWP